MNDQITHIEATKALLMRASFPVSFAVSGNYVPTWARSLCNGYMYS